jgi:uncharacterized protein
VRGEERRVLGDSGGAAAPVADRIEALDFVRGIALFGILYMNILLFGLPYAYSNPANAGGATGANLWVWIFGEIFVEGTQRGLFSILFGASTILLTSRLEAAGRGGSADVYFRRSLWLIAFGMFDAYVLLWQGDILFLYGVAALFLYAFRTLPPGKLFAFGAASLLIACAWNAHETWDLIGKHGAYEAASAAQAAGAELSPAQQQAIAEWPAAAAEFVVTPQDAEAAIAAAVRPYPTLFAANAPQVAYAESWGTYRYFCDVFGMMLIGMGLFRLGVLTLKVRTRVYLAMMGIGYAIGLAVNAAETRWVMDHGFNAVAFAQAHVTYDIGRLATTLGHLGALMLFVKSGLLGWLRRAVAAVGRMAVTNYLLQSLCGAVIFIGFGLFGQLQRYQLYYVFAAICAGELAFSLLWLRHFRFGPVEWLWRWLTYLRRPPLRRTAAIAQSATAA